jgi:hypothetical protein
MQIDKLRALWTDFGDIPVNADGLLEKAFLQFEPDADRMDVWHWFEAQHPDFSVAKMQGAA